MIYFLLAANVIMISVFLLKFNHLPPQIPLFYSKTWGESQLAESWMIFILLILLDFSFFINRFINKKYFPDNLLVKKIFTYLNLFIVIAFTAIFLKIILMIS